MKILVVEDEKISHILYKKILNGILKHEIEFAHNLEEAIEKATEDFDVIISDINLEQDFDGLILADIIKKQINCDIPIIGISGYDLDKKSLEESCFDYYIPKIQFFTSLNVIRKLLERIDTGRHIKQQESL